MQNSQVEAFLGIDRMANFSDNFNRADDESLGDAWAEDTAYLKIYGNAVYNATTNTQGLAHHKTSVGSATQYVKIKLTTFAESENYDLGVILRSQTASGYRYTVTVSGTSRIWWARYNWNNAVDDIDDEFSSFVAGDTMGVTIQGTGTSTVVKVWRNPTSDSLYNKDNWDSANDPADYTLTDGLGILATNPADTGTYVGVDIKRGTGASAVLDNFYAGAAPVHLIKILNETVQLTESIARWRRFIKLINETVQLTEGLVRRLRATKLINETIQISENIIRRLRSVKLINETIQITEGLVRRLRSVRIISETVQISENIVKVVSATVIKLINETVQVSESIIRRLRSIEIINEAIQLPEDIIRRLRSIKLINEVVQLPESIIRRLRATKLINETVQISENVVKSIIGLITIAAKTFNVLFKNLISSPVGKRLSFKTKHKSLDSKAEE